MTAEMYPDFESSFAERMEQEHRLKVAGFGVDGGGTDMTTLAWDIFVYGLGGPGDSNVVVLHSVSEVDAFLEQQAASNEPGLFGDE